MPGGVNPPSRGLLPPHGQLVAASYCSNVGPDNIPMSRTYLKSDAAWKKHKNAAASFTGCHVTQHPLTNNAGRLPPSTEFERPCLRQQQFATQHSWCWMGSSGWPAPNNYSGTPTVTVKNETISGRHSTTYNTDEFLGIPYAQPPVDQLRFRVPQSLNTTFDSKILSRSM